MAPLSIAPSFLSSFSTRKKKATGGRSFAGKCLGSIAGWDNNRLCFIRQGCGLSSYMSNRGGKGREKKERGDGNLRHTLFRIRRAEERAGQARPGPPQQSPNSGKIQVKRGLSSSMHSSKQGRGRVVAFEDTYKTKNKRSLTSGLLFHVYFFHVRASTMKVHFADK